VLRRGPRTRATAVALNLFTLVIIFTPLVLAITILRKRASRSAIRAATAAIDADSDGISRTLADGRVEAVSWDEVDEVDVFRTRVGPHKPAGGGVVLYGTAERGCIVPLDRIEESNLMVHIHRLPGFDIAAFLRVIGADVDAGSTDRAMQLLTPKPLQTTVTVWSRRPDPSDGDGPEEPPDGDAPSR